MRKARRESSPKLSEADWNPTCSFCGFRGERELIRAGSRELWICADCVELPVAGDSIVEGTRCTFCEEPLGGTRFIAVSKGHAVLCNECLKICIQIIADDRKFRNVERNKK